MNVLENLYQRTIIPLSLFGVDISITNGVITLWVAGISVLFFFFLATCSLKLVPGTAQNLAETMVIFLRNEMGEQLGTEKDKWLPFIIALFFFVLFCNLAGLIPIFSGVTANINVTGTLAVIVFLVVHLSGIKKRGLVSYARSLVPCDIPFFVQVLMVPIEFLSQLAKPFSLALRLFANMFAGHALMMILLSLIFIFKSYLVIPLPLLGDFIFSIFEVFVAFIQAFIFAYLSSLYIATALEENH
ncbi:MAG: F0F1 ATP synthase subunit A [bacterium]